MFPWIGRFRFLSCLMIATAALAARGALAVTIDGNCPASVHGRLSPSPQIAAREGLSGLGGHPIFLKWFGRRTGSGAEELLPPVTRLVLDVRVADRLIDMASAPVTVTCDSNEVEPSFEWTANEDSREVLRIRPGSRLTQQDDTGTLWTTVAFGLALATRDDRVRDVNRRIPQLPPESEARENVGEDAGKIVHFLRETRDGRNRLPRSLHFVWIGGELRPAAKANIAAWAERAQRSGWTIKMWTDPAADRSQGATQDFCGTTGLDCPDLTPLLDGRLRGYYDQVLGSEHKCPNYPAASDLARYSILLREGGVYLDVDIAPGAARLEGFGLTRLPNGRDIPLIAPPIRDRCGVQTLLGRTKCDKALRVTREQVLLAARNGMIGGEWANSFIGVPVQSEVMDRLIGDVHADMEKRIANRRKARLSTNVLCEAAGLTFEITGPLKLMETFKRWFSETERPTAAAVWFHHELPLDWVTEESEEQEH